MVGILNDTRIHKLINCAFKVCKISVMLRRLPPRPFSFPRQSSNFTPSYKQPKVSVTTRSLNVLGIEAKCVVLSSSMIHMSTTVISPGFAHKEINSVNCALFAFLSLSEDQPSYLNTDVATLICREASSFSVGAKYLARMAVETK